MDSVSGTLVPSSTTKIDWYSPQTFSVKSLSKKPAGFLATHLYSPVSPTSADAISSRRPSDKILMLTSPTTEVTCYSQPACSWTESGKDGLRSFFDTAASYYYMRFLKLVPVFSYIIAFKDQLHYYTACQLKIGYKLSVLK